MTLLRTQMVILQMIFMTAWPKVTESATISSAIPEECIHYDDMTFCQTVDRLIPQHLPVGIVNLTITYLGPGRTLRNKDLTKLSNLESLTVNGRVSSVKPDAFRSLASLKSLTLRGNLFTSLPDKLFYNQYTIESLTITGSHLTNIPCNLFSQILGVKTLNLGDNLIKICPSVSDGIGNEFRQLVNLTYLNLDGIEVLSDCKANITGSLFSNIKQIVNFSLAGANLFGVNDSIFYDLPKLKHLDISYVKPYSDCPSTAESLFLQLPAQLEAIIIQKWRNRRPFDDKCQITSKTLVGLKRLHHLRHLNAKYSDLAFGHTINSSLFKDFSTLEELDIGYCRIATLKLKVFEGCPNLRHLILNGNPLGPRYIFLSSFSIYSFERSKLDYLGLSRISAPADETLAYVAYPIFQSSRSLKTVDMSHNFFHKMPKLAVKRNPVFNNNSFEDLNLDDNFLTSFIQKDELQSKLCTHFPSLKTLSFNHNRLNNITGICENTVKLYLSGNQLSSENMKEIKFLKNLKVLNLTDNNIGELVGDEFNLMEDLEELYISRNKLYSLPVSLFKNNRRLRVLDISWNSLSTLDAKTVNHLHSLEYLNLKDNSITHFTQQFIYYIQSLKKLRFLGLTGNAFQCKCGDSSFTSFLANTDIVPVAQYIQCSDPSTNFVQTVTAVEYKDDPWFCTWKSPIIKTSIGLAVFVCTLLIALPCYKYRWYIKNLKLVLSSVSAHYKAIRFEYKCSFDGYISYDRNNDDDCDWVANKLVPVVEGGSQDGNGSEVMGYIPKLKLFIEERDTLIGSNRFTERCKALDSSRKIIIILTNSYLKSVHCLSEAELAGHEMHGSVFYQPNRVLVVVREELNEDIIKPPISSLLLQNVITVRNNEERVVMKALEKVKRFLLKPEFYYKKSHSRA